MENLTIRFLKELENIVDWGLGNGLINIREHEYLSQKYPATFYGLPKVHKGVMPLKGRPVVSGIGSLTQNAGIYLDRVVREFLISLWSYTRDTTGLLSKLEGICVEGALF